MPTASTASSASDKQKGSPNTGGERLTCYCPTNACTEPDGFAVSERQRRIQDYPKAVFGPFNDASRCAVAPELIGKSRYGTSKSMGHESIVYGYIKGATLRPGPQFFDLHPLNHAIINRLPKKDDWPFLTRSIFSVTGPRPEGGRYRRQIIHFGASFKMIETDWSAWLEKFEGLLRRLYWLEAKVHLETDFLGDHFYLWKG